MYTKAIALLFLAATTTTTTARILPRQNGVTCQTSSGSPKTEDVTDVINQVRGDGTGICSQTNDHASDCTTLVKHKSAAISICGGDDKEGQGNSCDDVAQYATEIQDACLSNGLVGGTYTISASQRVEVIHS